MGNTFRALQYTWKKEGFQALVAPWAPGWPSTCLDQLGTETCLCNPQFAIISMFAYVRLAGSLAGFVYLQLCVLLLL